MQSQNMRLYALILELLQRGNDLTLGPDSDGLLNFCDLVDSQSLEQPEAEAGKLQANDKGKQRARELPQEPEEDSSEVRFSSFLTFAISSLDADSQGGVQLTVDRKGN